MPIILRLTKGSELTFAELDGNFSDLDGRTDALENLNIGNRLNSLENNIQLDALDSEEIYRLIDSDWVRGRIVPSSYDSSGLASFDSDHFTLNNGHVTINLASYTPSDSTGIASFDSSNFVVTSGHVTINPNSPAGRVAGYTEIDSTGISSFDSDDFIVNSNGHVTLTDSAVRTRISAIDNGGAGSFTYNESDGIFIYTGAPDASTSTKGIASFNSSDFTVSSGHVSLASSGAAFSTTFNGVGSMGFFMVSGGSAAVGGTISGSSLKYGVGNTDGSGHKINQIGTNPLASTFIQGQSAQFTALALKRITGSSEASPSGTWRNLGPGHAYNGGQAPYGGTGLNLFVRVS